VAHNAVLSGEATNDGSRTGRSEISPCEASPFDGCAKATNQAKLPSKPDS
jgi:hypothetical protein